MVIKIHVCSGSRGEPHEPVRMEVDKNGIDIFRMPSDELVLTEGREWMDLAIKFGTNSFDGLRRILDCNGGDYYGCGDRMVCPICGATVTWRI